MNLDEINFLQNYGVDVIRKPFFLLKIKPLTKPGMKRKLHLAMALTGNTKVTKTSSHKVSVCMFMTVVLLFREAITRQY